MTGRRRAARDQVQGRIAGARSRWSVVDHGFRAYQRNREVLGAQLAAAVTYYGFLSFFPLIALVFSIVGYLSNYYPGVEQSVTDAVESAFPGLIGDGPNQINIDDIVNARAAAGIIGLVGLLYAGLGWLDSLRDGFLRVFGTLQHRPKFVRKKLIDVVVLTVLGTALLASIALSTLATSLTQQALDHVGLGGSGFAVGSLKVVSVAMGLGADVLVIAILLARLSGAHLLWRQVWSAALLGAVGFEILKIIASYLLSRTTSNPIYATFGVIVGLLVWMNVLSRLLVFCAAWAATQPKAPPVSASGPQTVPSR